MSKHVRCLGVTLERKLALQARSISGGWRKRKASPFWRQSKTNEKSCIQNLPWLCNYTYIQRVGNATNRHTFIVHKYMQSCYPRSCVHFYNLSAHAFHCLFLGRLCSICLKSGKTFSKSNKDDLQQTSRISSRLFISISIRSTVLDKNGLVMMQLSESRMFSHIAFSILFSYTQWKKYKGLLKKKKNHTYI